MVAGQVPATTINERREDMTDAQRDLLLELVRAGNNNTGIAKAMKVDVKTVYRWLQKNPDLKKAIEQIRREVLYEDAKEALAYKLRGHYVVEEKTVVLKDKNGERVIRTEKHRKHIPADTACVLFILKSVRPDLWGDRRDFNIDLSGKRIIIEDATRDDN